MGMGGGYNKGNIAELKLNITETTAKPTLALHSTTGLVVFVYPMRLLLRIVTWRFSHESLNDCLINAWSHYFVI